ncbi:MAG: ABC transporter permease [SAR86 cluster bacterium]|nr:ABC transporter permease [SAR86 cluster bacterium]|tara:strand:+ start:367 stop:1455 length:1089 start_codon:yes stop_codon:yes gene_type:complete
MFTSLQLHLAKVFLKIFLRNRQAILFSLFFPLIFIGAFSFSGSERDPFVIGISDMSKSSISSDFIVSLQNEALFSVVEGEFSDLKTDLISGEIEGLILIPQNFEKIDELGDLEFYVDASQTRQVSVIQKAIDASLISIERKIRNISPLFTINLKDVKARPQRYIDFLLPGLLAFMIMNLSIAGSGFNVVEYRRRGILKRLFVTPIRPKDFIISIVLARMLIVLVQLSVVLSIALFALNIKIIGSYFSFYLAVILGTFIFLCIGFALGSLAKTQEGIRPIVGLVTFPQVILSGVFFPISSMPEIIQPIVYALPLSSLASALRDIANDGVSLFTVSYSTIGILIWVVIAFFISTKFFVWKEVAK